MKSKLARYIARYVSLNDFELDLFYSKLQSKKYSKKEFLLVEGSICRFNFFIIKGVVRSFFIDSNGKEKITQFAIDNWWVTNMESFIRNKPSTQYIQAVEDTSLLYISKEELEQLYIDVPNIERLFRKITENMLIAALNKNDVFLQMKSRDRYEDFVAKLPDFIQRVPQYMIASYLEITPEYLSELRKFGK